MTDGFLYPIRFSPSVVDLYKYRISTVPVGRERHGIIFHPPKEGEK